MGKSRSERREASGILFNLYGPETALGFPVIGSTTTEQAAEKVACGSWREVIYTDGGFAGYQIVAKAKVVIRPRIDRALTITLSELQRNAGLFGRSRTLGMSEWKRTNRLEWHRAPGTGGVWYTTGKILAPEDAIERAIEKVKLWPYPASRVDDGSGEPVFGDRAVRCYPKTK